MTPFSITGQIPALLSKGQFIETNPKVIPTSLYPLN